MKRGLSVANGDLAVLSNIIVMGYYTRIEK